VINLKRACSPMPAILPFTTQEISASLSSAVRIPASAARKGRTVAHTPAGPSAYGMVLIVRLEPAAVESAFLRTTAQTLKGLARG
jgi:hypothetical protein